MRLRKIETMLNSEKSVYEQKHKIEVILQLSLLTVLIYL